MTSPTVTETTAPPAPVDPDPFIDDAAVVLPPPDPPKRRRIWD